MGLFDKFKSKKGREAIDSLNLPEVVIERHQGGTTTRLRAFNLAEIERTPEGRAFLQEGYLAIHFGAMKGDSATVTEWLQSGGDVDARGGAKDHTGLQLAAREGHLEVVRMLLKHGANVNAQNNVGGSSLHAAAFQGRLEVVRELITSGANPKLQNGSGRCAVDLAEAAGHAVVVAYLRTL
jgi:ankyrin repeat protein